MAQQNPPSGEKPDINNLAKRYVSFMSEIKDLNEGLEQLEQLESGSTFEFFRLVVAEMRAKNFPEDTIENMLRAAYWGGKHWGEVWEEILKSPNILLSPEH